MKNLLLIIDLQKDFINDSTEHLIIKIQKLINSKKYEFISFTKFINFPNSQFENKLNWHGCTNEEGQKIVVDTKDYKIFNKSVYTAYNDDLKKFLVDNKIDNIYLCGIDSECCILKTAMDLFENNYNVYVLKDYCASMHGSERHESAFKILKRNIGKDYIIKELEI